MNTEMTTSTVGAYTLAHMAAQEFGRRAVNIAIVVQPGQTNEDMRSFETAAHNVGVRCEFFEIEGEAERI